MRLSSIVPITFLAVLFASVPSLAQLVDRTRSPHTENQAAVQKSLTQQVGAGRGNINTPNSSLYIIARDPFRSIRRGRQIFQRKFAEQQGLGPITDDGAGLIEQDDRIGAGLADSCAGCHGRPRGSAGHGGDVATRPDSRDAPHLFGLGLVEMLADEMTFELRKLRQYALAQAASLGTSFTVSLDAKGINFGQLTAFPNGSVDNSQIEGVDNDLRIKPFFHDGRSFSIREFAIGAFDAEMGLETYDPDLLAAHNGATITTPAGMVLDGSLDTFPAPPALGLVLDPDGDGVTDEIDPALIDHMEIYLLNYFRPALYQPGMGEARGKQVFLQIGCGDCHVPDLQVDADRRVADVDTAFNPAQGIFNRLFSTVSQLFTVVPDPLGLGPAFKQPNLGSFLVTDFYSDLKRHDLGPNFHERQYDGTIKTHFVTEPLWGVGTTAPYGHDGRSIHLHEVILRHGGEAQVQRDLYAELEPGPRSLMLAFLQSLVLFPPDDTASTLDGGNTSDPAFPQRGHGAIDLSVLFNNPADKE